MSLIHFLLWSNKHQSWWRPDGRGYTDDIVQAGAYTQAQAVEAVTRSALCMDRTRVTLMVAAPPGWVPPADQGVFGPGPLVEVMAAFLESRVNLGPEPSMQRVVEFDVIDDGPIERVRFVPAPDEPVEPGPETVGELHDRLPVDEWVNLPEFGVRVKRVTPVGRSEVLMEPAEPGPDGEVA